MVSALTSRLSRRQHIIQALLSERRAELDDVLAWIALTA